MAEENKQDVKSNATKSESGREERLAAELRSNLKKRKDHMRDMNRKSTGSEGETS